ncbi:hypothetical protein [Erwinia sp. 198]|uniref:hypothetical protein n=1 Tax=Erwinia sp. 198 TaxID=2022746 RepID=UPI000F669DC7|nr:hypothetical protein [Erwinia sp. 198]RRZ89430.1 hypothetical protein EGK14_16380 [Erwinia sp. 198]
MPSLVVLFGALVVTVMIVWWHIIINITEIVNIRRLKARRGRIRGGGPGSSQNLLMALLVAEILVALAISTLNVLMLSELSF